MPGIDVQGTAGRAYLFEEMDVDAEVGVVWSVCSGLAEQVGGCESCESAER